MRLAPLFAAVLSIFVSTAATGTTLLLEGEIEQSVTIRQERTFSVPQAGLKSLTFRFADPSSVKGPYYSQEISSRKVQYLPEPESVKSETDSFGNSFTTVTWKGLKKEARVIETYRADIREGLKEIKSSAPFPVEVKSIPDRERRFLNPTPLVQSNTPEIKALSSRLTAGAVTQVQAVSAVMGWVADNISYKTPVPDYDALKTLSTGEGNCQNFAHLSMALLRSAGIPARIAGGISLGKPWKVPAPGGTLQQTIGQGGHAWMEVWYPDLGWVPYDAQQSHLFVGPRHIRQTGGADSVDINDSWRASPALPGFREDISAEYNLDRVSLALKGTGPVPSNYIMAVQTGYIPSKPIPDAQRPGKPPVKAPEGAAEFGNLDFPSLVDIYRQAAGTGTRTFDKETAEYVTGEYTYAQAFTTDNPLRLDTVSLAMHKFGGRLGSLWVDVVKDEGGRPGMEGLRSMPLFLDSVKFHPGYGWFDFPFAGEEGERVLKPGRYWIILRKSKDVIVSWFYTPGNRTGAPDDARSTSTGTDWSDVLNRDFNFRVKGVFSENMR